MKEHLDFFQRHFPSEIFPMPWLLLWGGAAGPAWEDKALTAHSPAARTKVLNKKIHLDVHPWETLVNWEIVGVKRTRRSGVGGGCKGEPQKVSVLIFSHLRRGK